MSGLWSRMAGLERARVTTALERRPIVQGTMMRATIHVVSASDYWPLMIATREARRQWFLRVYRGPYGEADFTAANETVRDLLTSGPKPAADSRGRGRPGPVELGRHLPRHGPGAAVGDLGPAAGRPLRVGRGLDPTDRDNDGGRHRVVDQPLSGWFWSGRRDRHRYLGGVAYGSDRPGSRADGSPPLQAEDGKVLLDLKRVPLPDAEVTAPVRFLPVWDAILLVHARRKAVIAEEHRPIIFNTKTPQSMPTFMVDGSVAGTWRYEGGRVKLEPVRADPEKVETRVGGRSQSPGRVPCLSSAVRSQVRWQSDVWRLTAP